MVRQGLGFQCCNLAGSKKLHSVLPIVHPGLYLSFAIQFLFPYTHLYSILCTPTNTVNANWAEVKNWEGSYFVIKWGKTGPSINSTQLHLPVPQQRDHHLRTCRTGSCHKMWHNLAPGHTQSENEILWSLYVTEHYAKCDTLSCICRNALFPQRCHSVDLKIKQHFPIYILPIFSILKIAQIGCTKSISQSVTGPLSMSHDYCGVPLWLQITEKNKGPLFFCVFVYVMVLNSHSYYVVFHIKIIGLNNQVILKKM